MTRVGHRHRCRSLTGTGTLLAPRSVHLVCRWPSHPRGVAAGCALPFACISRWAIGSCREVVVKFACMLFAALLVAADARGQALLHDVPDAPAPHHRRRRRHRPPERRPCSAAASTSSPSTSSSPTREQKFVTGLRSEGFAVFEDGVQQDVSFFAAPAVPLDLAILLDTSASMSDKMQRCSRRRPASPRHLARRRPRDDRRHQGRDQDPAAADRRHRRRRSERSAPPRPRAARHSTTAST